MPGFFHSFDWRTRTADSTLDLTGEEAPRTGVGHGTRALGPSDTSDSGSDVVGGPGTSGGLSDDNARRAPTTTRKTAGADLGDADLDSDTDSTGSGERASAGRDAPNAEDLNLEIETVAAGGEDDEVIDTGRDESAPVDISGVVGESNRHKNS